MKESFSGRDGFLYDLLRYHLGWTDQYGQAQDTVVNIRFQSMLALCIADLLSDDIDPALPVAAAVQLICDFMDVHGEVQAGRLGSDVERPTIWWIWGPAQAINAGDGLHALARSAMMRLSSRRVDPSKILESVRLLDNTCLTLCEGQYIDLTFQDQVLIRTSDYMEMVSKKSGALSGCAARLGALVSGSNDDICEEIGEFGTKIGSAWQLKQDVEGLWGDLGNGVTPDNLLNKKKTLPLIHALETGSTAVKREITGIYMKRVLEPSDISRVLELLDEVDAKNYALHAIEDILVKARDNMRSCGIDRSKTDELIDWVIGQK